MTAKALRHFSIGLFLFLGLQAASTSFAFTIDSSSFLTNLEPLTDAKFVVTPGDGHADLIKAFDNAKKSINVGIFGISDPNIANSLSAAQKRGVAVTVICDKYCESNPKRLAITNQLRADGVQVYIASTGFTGFSITHWKMFVIDESLAFVSTMNFISSSDKMRDMGVFLTNPSIVKEILTVFAADIENSKNQTAVTPALSQPNLVWSPINSEAKLVQLINSAEKTIDIWIENMGENQIHAALAAAVQRHVQVRVLTSLCGMGMPPAAAYATLKNLSSQGISVQGMPYPASTDVPYIHAKTINVDHQVVFLGSENFSPNSLLKARELGLIFNNAEIQSRMAALYETDWKNSQTIPETAPATCDALPMPTTDSGT